MVDFARVVLENQLLLVAGGVSILAALGPHARSPMRRSLRASARTAAARAPARAAAPGSKHPTGQSFDRASLAASARALLIGVKSGLALRDVGGLGDRVAPELQAALQAQCDRLRAARQSHRIEKIDITHAEVVDASTAGGREFATVRLRGTRFDYTLDDATGHVLEGSRTIARRFEERWTFARAIGARAWRLEEIREPVG